MMVTYEPPSCWMTEVNGNLYQEKGQEPLVTSQPVRRRGLAVIAVLAFVVVVLLAKCRAR